jgi:hypothetical protein
MGGTALGLDCPAPRALQDMGNPTGSDTSFNSQPTYVVQQTDASGNPYFIYMADNWIHGGPNGLIDASCVARLPHLRHPSPGV